jgi:tRNA pseudouridine55 synthase
MPKAARTAPLSCLFAVNKPTASISRTLLNDLQPLFASSSLFADPNAPIEKNQRGKRGKNVKFRGAAVKIGQGGTLDPLADGVLGEFPVLSPLLLCSPADDLGWTVIGMNNATKHLAKFLDCTKEYRAIGLFGCSTDSYDSDGKRVKTMPFDEVTEARIEAILENYRGEIEQIPPM